METGENRRGEGNPRCMWCAVCGVYAVCCVILHANTDATLSLFLFSYCVILHANTLTLSLFLFSYPFLPPYPPGCVSVRSVLVTGGMALLFHFSWMVAGIFWMLGIPNGTDTTPCDPELYSFGRNLAIVWGAIFLLHSVYTYFTRELH